MERRRDVRERSSGWTCDDDPAVRDVQSHEAVVGASHERGRQDRSGDRVPSQTQRDVTS